jgi:hypothetical protein
MWSHFARPHLTFAVTDAVPAIVNVHVLLVLPPLEQAPDQAASRPFETLSVIAVPVVKRSGYRAADSVPTVEFRR